MAISAATESGRRAAEARMTARVTIRRSVGRSAQDEATGRQVQQSSDVATNIPFRLDGASNNSGGTRRVEINGVEYQQATAVGHLPATYADLHDSDILVVTSGEWSGSSWRVVEATKGDQKTARRVPIVEA